jgi:betaine-aldehyde dehydrogenase
VGRDAAATRAGYLRRIVERLQTRSEELAQSITGEVGMPIKLSRAIQVGAPVYNWKAYAKLAESFEFEAKVGNSLVVREPWASSRPSRRGTIRSTRSR